MQGEESDSDPEVLAGGDAQWAQQELTPQGTESDTSDGTSSNGSPVRPAPPAVINQVAKKQASFQPQRKGILKPKTLFASPQKRKLNDDSSGGSKLISKREKVLIQQKKRLSIDEGTWVQCTNNQCNKWRHLKDVQEPCSLATKWQCSMNKDADHDRCDKPEEDHSHLEFYYLKHGIGCLVWAKLHGFPWWPAMVDDDPDTRDFFWTNGFSEIPTHYHVVFLDFNVTRAWVSSACLKTYRGHFPQDLQKVKRDLRFKLAEATRRADQALLITIPERLKKFSFVNCFKGEWPKTPESSSDSDSGMDCQLTDGTHLTHKTQKQKPKDVSDNNTDMSEQTDLAQKTKKQKLKAASNSKSKQNPLADFIDKSLKKVTNVDIDKTVNDNLNMDGEQGNKESEKQVEETERRKSIPDMSDKNSKVQNTESSSTLKNGGSKCVRASSTAPKNVIVLNASSEELFNTAIESTNMDSNLGDSKAEYSVVENANTINSRTSSSLTENSETSEFKSNVDLIIESVIAEVGNPFEENLVTAKVTKSNSIMAIKQKKKNLQKFQTKKQTLENASLLNGNANITKEKVKPKQSKKAQKSKKDSNKDNAPKEYNKTEMHKSKMAKSEIKTDKTMKKMKPVFTVKKKNAIAIGEAKTNTVSTLPEHNSQSNSTSSEPQTKLDVYHEVKFIPLSQLSSSAFETKSGSQTTHIKFSGEICSSQEIHLTPIGSNSIQDNSMLTQDDPSDFEELSQLILEKLSPPSSQLCSQFEMEE